MSFEECVREGLIKKSENARDRVGQSLSLGDRFLGSAEKNFKIDEYEVCEIISYNALFHYARALLFDKGYIERSHACLFLALNHFYPKNKELFIRAGKLRIERHNLQYSGFAADKESARFSLEFVREFGKTAKGLLKK
ncbi:MAG: HEPN domain-containing protein [Candidatus Micrarchaeota archaeon]